MSFEHIEAKITKTLATVKMGSAYFIPDSVLEDILGIAYKQGQLDGAAYVEEMVNAAITKQQEARNVT